MQHFTRLRERGLEMIDGVAGIVLRLNPEFEDLDTKSSDSGGAARIKKYLRDIKIHGYYNVPKKLHGTSYKYLCPGQWLFLYDPYAINIVDDEYDGAITAAFKVTRQEHHPDNPEFPCYNYFDPATLWLPIRPKIRLDDLEILFDNFHRSRRYRNVSERQFDRLMRHAQGHPKP